MTRVLLLSTYEQGHQPLGLAAPAATLREAGHEVECYDLAISGPPVEAVRSAELVGISVPMHTAARLGLALARRVREVAPAAQLVFYGLYASPLHERLVGSGLADAVVGGEYEPGLVALADALAAAVEAPQGRRGLEPTLPGLGGTPLFPRRLYPLPDRRGLPALEQYARVEREDGTHLAGYVEATRGCAHHCTHCPLTPVYGGRLRLVQADVVLGDIEQQVRLGAAHVTFGDPDFLNAVPHALAILEAAHAAHPALSFDVTVKVEHLLEHEALLPRLHELGVIFVTSAFESCDNHVLALLEKDHTRADLDAALAASRRAGLVLRPTWVAFTPWSSLEGFAQMLEFIEANGLVRHVQPVQYALRLLLPPGSPLNAVLEREARLGAFDDELLTYAWRHEDERVEALQARLAGIVEIDATTHGHDADASLRTFALVKRATLEALTGWPHPSVEVLRQPRAVVPGLTESWFC